MVGRFFFFPFLAHKVVILLIFSLPSPTKKEKYMLLFFVFNYVFMFVHGLISETLINSQTEVNYLGQLHHHNLVKLIGYCVEGEDRLLVYEFMPKGSLENHLFRSKLP